MDVSVGESVRVMRELQGMSQNQLAEASGISQATISGIENDRVRLGVERARVLAVALDCHPGVLLFPGWELPQRRRQNLDDDLKAAFRVEAALRGHSMEEEARRVLRPGLSRRGGEQGLGRRIHERFSAAGGVDLPEPDRSAPPR
nr:helix-turn-helix domain-containing protein [Zeimonas sediminis]